MSAREAIVKKKTNKLITAIKSMLELGANNRRMAVALNRLCLFTPQSNRPWTTDLVTIFCKRHAKKLILDDGENLFQSKKRPSEIEDFFPYPNYGPFS